MARNMNVLCRQDRGHDTILGRIPMLKDLSTDIGRNEPAFDAGSNQVTGCVRDRQCLDRLRRATHFRIGQRL